MFAGTHWEEGWREEGWKEEGEVEVERSVLDCLLLYWEKISQGRRAGGWTEERSV